MPERTTMNIIAMKHQLQAISHKQEFMVIFLPVCINLTYIKGLKPEIILRLMAFGNALKFIFMNTTAIIIIDPTK